MPKSKAQFTGLVLTGILLLSAAAANSASAAGTWLVNGTKLASGATVALASTAKAEESTALSVPSIGISLTCSGKSVTAKKAFIQGPNTGGAEALTYEGCSEVSPSTCTIESKIETQPLTATIEQQSTAGLDKVNLAPKTGKALAEIAFKGTCAMAGEQPLAGKLGLAGDILQTENSEQPVEGLETTEDNSLELFKGKAYLEPGVALFKLASALPFELAQNPGSREFSLNPTFQQIVGADEPAFKLKSKIVNAKAEAIFNGILAPASQWGTKPAEVGACEGAYPVIRTCEWKIKYEGTKKGKVTYIVKDKAGNVAGAMVEGRP